MWVVIPLGIVVGLGVVAVLLHSRHLRKRKSRQGRPAGTRANPQARRALERNLQQAWMRGAPGDRAARISRWGAGARSTRWGGWHFMFTRGEEGLNELGEAPPPYRGSRNGTKKASEGTNSHVDVEGEAAAEAEDVEMDALEGRRRSISPRGAAGEGTSGEAAIRTQIQRDEEQGQRQDRPARAEQEDDQPLSHADTAELRSRPRHHQGQDDRVPVVRRSPQIQSPSPPAYTDNDEPTTRGRSTLGGTTAATTTTPSSLFSSPTPPQQPPISSPPRALMLGSRLE